MYNLNIINYTFYIYYKFDFKYYSKYFNNVRFY